MGKNISKGYISDTINGIMVNSSIKCNSGNYLNDDEREVSYIVVHYTGNSKDTAKNNATYFKNNDVNVSAHFFVDESNIYQSAELRDVAWHCGTDGTYYHSKCRNSNSFAIEMCCSGNYKVSDKTIKNSAHLCAYLCEMLGIKSGEVDTYVLRHYDVTHKQCPAQMVSDMAQWVAYKTMVKDILNEKSQTVIKPTSTSATSNYTAGQAVSLSNVSLYASSTTKNVSKKITGTYYLWSKDVVSNRIRITTPKSNVGKTGQVTGWIDVSAIGGTTTNTNTNTTVTTYKKGDAVNLVNKPLYASSSSTKFVSKKTGTYYIYDGVKTNGRYRITNSVQNCGRTPVASYVTGWIEL